MTRRWISGGFLTLRVTLHIWDVTTKVRSSLTATMSALGQKRAPRREFGTTALLPRTDMHGHAIDGRYVPEQYLISIRRR